MAESSSGVCGSVERSGAQRLEQVGHRRLLAGVAGQARHASRRPGGEHGTRQAAPRVHAARHGPVRLAERPNRGAGAEVDAQDPQARRAGERADRPREGDRGEVRLVLGTHGLPEQLDHARAQLRRLLVTRVGPGIGHHGDGPRLEESVTSFASDADPAQTTAPPPARRAAATSAAASSARGLRESSNPPAMSHASTSADWRVASRSARVRPSSKVTVSTTCQPAASAARRAALPGELTADGHDREPSRPAGACGTRSGWRRR